MAIEFPSLNGPLGLSSDDLAQCVHCGLCLNACPTYRATGLETESPRGRIYLMRAVEEGRIAPDETFQEHMELCLVCRSCETACPSGVQFAKLMEGTRASLWHSAPGPRLPRAMRRITFGILFPHRRVFRMAFRGLRLYQRWGLQSAVRRSGVLRYAPPTVREQEALLPRVSSDFFAVDASVPPRIPDVPRVGFVAGCVMSTAFADVQRSSVRVLQKFGCQVITPPGQGCCGALNVHAGEHHHAKRMARELIESMLRSDLDAIIINSAGCGSVMKEYHHLFSDEPSYLHRVHEFEHRVRDFSEYLVTLPAFNTYMEQRSETQGEATMTAVYQDACHLRHAQRVIAQPRQLLGLVPNLQLMELAHPDQCCGSAGTYNVEHPTLAGTILGPKIEDIMSHRPDMVVSGNPGCILQLQKGLAEAGVNIPVQHIATVLDRALDGGHA